MNFRRWITALAVLAVFTVAASAQVTNNLVSCSVGATTPKVRAEGITERVGDVLVTCINGIQLNTGNVADRINLTVTYSAPLTNANDGSSHSLGSDIMLTIDEPNSMTTAAATELGIQGYGPNAHITSNVCTTANQTGAGNLTALNQLTPCPAFSFLTGTPNVYYATSLTGVAGGGNASNVYQGQISNTAGTAVTFYNVPFVPPFLNTGSQGTLVSRVFRITGARVNPNGQSSITATVSQPVTNINDVSTFAPLTSPTVNVGNVQSSINPSTSSSPLSVCIQTALVPVKGQPQLPASAAILTFGEAFGGAFKTRVVPITTGDIAWQTGVDLQANTQPVNGTYSNGAFSNANSESGILIPVAGSGFAVAGLANTGTRLKAVFANLDSNATYYVSVNNITDYNNPLAANKTPAAAGDLTVAPFAVLQTQGSEVAAYAAAGGSVPAGINSTVPVVQLAVSSSHTAEAVWEITNLSGGADSYTFAVYAVFAPNTVNPNPATAATVQLGYDPTTGTNITNVPRFLAPPAGAAFLNLLPCRTTLLFPFVTSALASAPGAPIQAWATGVAIENTGLDPLTTIGGTGTCALNFYGPGAPPAMTSASLAPGAAFTFLVSDPAGTGVPTYWTGYVFAVCNFNYGHGFVFIEDNTRQMAMGYLGTVLDQQTSSVPRGGFTLGEALKN